MKQQMIHRYQTTRALLVRGIHRHRIVLFIAVVIALPFAMMPIIKSNILPQTGFRRNILTNRIVAALPKNILGASFTANKTSLTMDISRGTSKASFALALDQAKTQIGNTDLSFQAKNGTTVRYETLPDGVKEEIILEKPPTRTTMFSTISVDNAEPMLTPEGQIVFVDAQGTYQFHIRQPFAIDANGVETRNITYKLMDYDDIYQNASKDINNRVFVSRQLFGSLKKSTRAPNQTNQYMLVLTLDPAWLNDPNRAYPVIIDPTVVHDTTSEFATGQLDRVKDTGSGASPVLETYYQELPTDQYTIALWHINETANDSCAGSLDVCDSSGNGNHGTAINTSITTSGQRLGAAARTFAGSDYFKVTSSALAAGGTKTVEAWIKTTDTQGMIYSSYDGTNGYELYAGASVGNLLLWSNGGSTLDSGIAVNDGQWHHVAAVWDGVNGYLYIDGDLVKYGTRTITTNTSNEAQVGDYCTGACGTPNALWYFDGTIDEMRVSNIARTPKEIKLSAQRRPYSVYTSDVIDLTKVASWNSLTWTENGVTTGDGETLKDSTSLIAQWNLNETSGTTANNDAEGTSCGGTPANCDGTLSGFDSTASQDADPDSSWTANNRRWGAGAIQFDGIDSNINIPDTSALSFGNGTTDSAFSIAFWIFPKNLTTAQWIINKRGASQEEYQVTIGTAGEVRTALFSGLGTTAYIGKATISSLTLGAWNNVVVTYDGSRTENGIKIYINGKLANMTTNSTGSYVAMNNSTSPVVIGKYGGGSSNYFVGTLDTTAVLGRELTISEVLSNYNAGNVEFQTRVGATADANDGTWEAWRPVTNETAVASMDSDAANWTWDSTATYMPQAKSDESTIKIEGTGSLKQIVGQPQDSDANVVGLWHLDETGGTGAYLKDYSGNANHGTPTGTTIVNGISGKARSFNGTSDYINAGDSPVWDFGAGNFTIEAWVKRGSTGTEDMIVGKDDEASGGRQFLLKILTSGTIRILYAIATDATVTLDTTATIVDNKWHHVAGQRNGNAFNIYIDGALSATGTTAGTHGTMQSTATSLRIGQREYAANEDYFAGSIDEVRISNIARSAEEIAEAYRSGRDHYLTKTISSTDVSAKTTLPFYVAADRPGTYLEATVGESAFANYQTDANTIALMHLDEQSGSGAYLQDASSNNNDGTPTGAVFTQGKIGKARYFDNANDYVDLGSGASFDFGNNGAFTQSGWVNPATLADYDAFVSKVVDGRGGTYTYMTVFMANGRLSAYNTTAGWVDICPAGSIAASKWSYIAFAYNGTTMYGYVNGQLCGSAAFVYTDVAAHKVYIGSWYSLSTLYDFNGFIDEVTVSNAARTADEIRQAYEIGLRTHPITIDFGANLNSGNLITGTSDLSFTIDATYYGLPSMGSNLYKGDKIIVRENYDGTEYIAQGTVTAVTLATGAVTVGAWDSGSTVPSGGFTVNASVFKWQREYWSVTEPLDAHLNATTLLTLRLTDGNEGRTIWLDDFRSNSAYLTTATGSTITSSTGNRYFQYRAILNSADEAVSTNLTVVTLDYVQNTAPATPTLDAPTDTATNQILSTVLRTTTTDADSDYLRYKIELCTNVGMTTNCQTFDQTSSQTGWSGQNTQTNTAYTSGTQGVYTIQTPLTTSTTYYWRSYAIDPGGLNTWSSTQGTPYSFTTTAAPTAPTDPYAEGTTNPTAVADLTPEFSAVHNDPNSDAANFYEIEVNTQSDFGGTVMWDTGAVSMTNLASGVRSTDVSYAGTALTFNGSTYYWRIRFTDVNGAVGSWSATQNFTMNTPPGTPSLYLPANGSTVGLTPVFRTTATDVNSDYLRYKIELCTNVGMTANCQTFDQTSSQTGWSGQNTQTNTAYTNGTEAVYTTQSALSVSTTYYWRSYAIDPGGSNTWSGTQGTPNSFTTGTGNTFMNIEGMGFEGININ